MSLAKQSFADKWVPKRELGNQKTSNHVCNLISQKTKGEAGASPWRVWQVFCQGGKGCPALLEGYLPITRITASLATEAPGSKLMAVTVPLAGAGSEFCIFMASRTHTRSPVLTLSPTWTA